MSVPRRLRPALLLAAGLLASLAVVCAVSPPGPRHVLRVGLPQHARLRRVRMYSVEPDLQEVYNSSSLALVSRLQLLDYTDCTEDMARCPVYASCDGGVAGEATCRCSRGFYLSHGQCQPCAKTVPDGQFLLTPCTRVRNAVFKACKVCSNTQYLAAPCTATQDTICVDVAFPVGILPWNQSLLEDVGADVTAGTSSNVFLERLRDMTELEAPMYNSNNQQSMELVWERESGLQIKLQVTGDYLVPEYQEVPHADDTNFFMYNKDVPESTKELFAKIKKNYCSHPMPDYYSLHLDIVEDRTSAAQEVTCDSKNASVPPCPQLYRDGDRFLARDINKNCSELANDESTYIPMSLYDMGNSVVCPHTSPLLTSVFRLPPLSVKSMAFPSPECQRHELDCQSCLEQPCPPESGAECCNLHCYSKAACVHSFSPACPPAPIKCATGDVNLFTLSPIFEKLGRRFMCHLEYRQPPYLYNVSYEVILPSLNLVLPFRNYSVGAQDRFSHRRQFLEVDFMRIHHDTFYPIHPELVAIGEHGNLTSPNPLTSFTVHPLKQRRQDFSSSRSFNVHQNFRVRYATYVQFQRPFWYSSSSFHRDGCEKNLSKVYPNQTVYKAENVRLQTKVFKRKGAGSSEHLTYQMYRKDQPPYIRLTVPAAQSILSTFQRVNSTTILAASLQSSLLWEHALKKWRIVIAGKLSDCPGIISLQLVDKMLTRCIAHYDAFVACPPTFALNFTFYEPQGRLPDIFVVLINDSITSHKLVLSSIVSPRHLPSPSPLSPGGALARSPVPTSSSLWTPVMAILLLTFLGLLTLFGLHVCIRLHVAKTQAVPDKPEPQEGDPPAPAPAPESEKFQGEGLGGPDASKGKQPASALMIYVFILLYIVYCVVFSFSVGFGVLYFAQLTLLSNMNQSGNLSAHLYHQMNVSLRELRQLESGELQRMLAAVQERQAACDAHLDRETRRVAEGYGRLSWRQLEAIYVQNGSLAHFADTVLGRSSQRHLQQTRDYIARCNATAHQHLAAFSAHFHAYLAKVAASPWLDFPREVFQRRETAQSETGGMTDRQLQRFLAWLQVDKALELLDVHRAIDQRLSEILPTPAFDIPSIHHMTSLDQQHVAMTPSTLTQLYRYSVLTGDADSETPPPREPRSRESTGFSHPNATGGQGGMGEGESVSAMDVAIYILVACFLALDIMLWSFRLIWLYRQVMAARQGYEDKIPTDAVSSNVLRIQTGHHAPQPAPTSWEHPYNYYLVRQQEERWTSDSELYVYFCQAYPKSKEDILREIWAHKMAAKPKCSREKLAEHPCLVNWRSFCHWLHRVMLSGLLWRISLAAALCLAICLMLHLLDTWVVQGPAAWLFGEGLLVSELRWHAATANQLLTSASRQLNDQLAHLKGLVDNDVHLLNNKFTDTVQRQTDLLVSLMSVLCGDSETAHCNVSRLLMPLPAPVHTCNFLPVQVHLLPDSDTRLLQAFMQQELLPLVDQLRRLVFTCGYVLLLYVCAILLCHALARVMRYYLFMTGKLPRVQVFQVSDTGVVLADPPHDQHKQIQRTGSWLESCESGVYVGDNEDSTRESVI